MRKVLYILGHLSDEDIEWMVRAGRRIQAGGMELIREGRPVEDLFFVVEGEVAVTVAGLGTVATLGRGEVVGEMSLVDSAPPSATVTGGARCVVVAIDRQRINQRLRSDPGFAGRFYKALAIFLADRLRTTQARKTGRMLVDEVMEDELDDAVLDTVSLAGLRFEHMMSKLAAAAV